MSISPITIQPFNMHSYITVLVQPTNFVIFFRNQQSTMSLIFKTYYLSCTWCRRPSLCGRPGGRPDCCKRNGSRCHRRQSHPPSIGQQISCNNSVYEGKMHQRICFETYFSTYGSKIFHFCDHSNHWLLHQSYHRISRVF